MSVTIVRRINHRLGVGLSSRRRCDEDLCGLSVERLQDRQKYGGTLNWKDRKQHGAEPRQPKAVMGVGVLRSGKPCSLAFLQVGDLTACCSCEIWHGCFLSACNLCYNSS